MPGTIYLNGRFLDHGDAALDPLDRGVLLGDGLFETIRCEEGQLLYHVGHFARLARGARILEIPWNLSNEELLALCQQCLDANNLKHARLRITLTRGEYFGSPEISAPGTAPTLLIHAQSLVQETLEAQRARGWSAHVVNFPINHRSPLAQVKSTSYQEHLLARREARRHQADEGILLNTDGLLAEGAMSNIFIVRGSEVLTPPVEDGALPGITRLKVGIVALRLGIGYRETSLTLEDLLKADEAFCTSAITEVMPLVMVSGKAIGEGIPGPAAARIFAALRADVTDYLRAMRRG